MSRGKPIKESGQVLRLEGNIAVIGMYRASACAGCAASGVCHSLSGTDERELRAINAIDAQPGERVEVEIPPGAALRAATWVYLVPTVLMVAVALVVHFALATHFSAHGLEMVTALSAVGSLALFIVIAWWIQRRRGPNGSHFPTVVRTL